MKAEKHAFAVWRAGWVLSGVVALLALAGCGGSVPRVASKSDIWWLSRDAKSVVIADLPVALYPKLEKFSRLGRIDFCGECSDAKLEAVAKVDIHPWEVLVASSSHSQTPIPGVTDKGAAHLATMKSLTDLGLSRTLVTDTGLELLARTLPLKSVGIEHCPNVSAAGLFALAKMPTLESIGFSTENISMAEVEETFGYFSQVEYCGIDDTGRKLDKRRIDALGKAKGIKVTFRKYEWSDGQRTAVMLGYSPEAFPE